MKIYVLYIVLLLATSCDSFLEYKDKDKVIPSTLQHYEELIYGELLIKNANGFGRRLEMMTDDIGNMVPAGISSNNELRDLKYYGWYIWAKEPQIDPKGVEYIDDAWEYFYHAILMCNIIESEVGVLPDDDTDGVKWRLLGEVQCLRAMSYYYLVGMYGAPYRDSTVAKTAMGVPVNTTVGIYDRLYERSTLQEVYDLIEKDLKSALTSFAKGKVKNTIFRPNAEVARLFLSRIYVTEKRYDKVIEVCQEAILESGASIMTKDFLNSRDTYSNPMFSESNSSIFFTWMERWSWDGLLSTSTSSARYVTSIDLRSRYDQNDIRLAKFFNLSWNYFTPIKETGGTNTYRMCYRIEEFYYNLAEAYIESGEYILGLDEVNKVRKERFNGDDYKLVASNKEDAIEKFRMEKRKEFCFEDIRWYDMKRWGVRVVHEYNDINNNQLYESFVLETDGPNYILPLPLDIQRRNDKIEQPVRVDTKVVN